MHANIGNFALKFLNYLSETSFTTNLNYFIFRFSHCPVFSQRIKKIKIKKKEYRTKKMEFVQHLLLNPLFFLPLIFIFVIFL